VSAGLHNEQSQLFRGVHVVGVRLGADAEPPQQRVRRAVQQADRGRHDLREDHQRDHQIATHGLGLHECDRLRGQLAEHDVQEGDDDERGGGACHRVHGRRWRSDAERGERPVHESRERGLADPAQAERRERDPELRGRDVAVQVLHGGLGRLRETVALARHLIDSAAPRAHQRELGGNEKRVRNDQEDYQSQAPGVRAEAQMFSCLHSETTSLRDRPDRSRMP